MKRINALLFIFVSLLASCNRHHEEGLYTYYDIVKEFEPQSTILDWGNMTSEERHRYPRKGFVINSMNEFPEEANINMTDLKLMDIDFSRYSLLVEYALIPGYIKAHKLSWFYDNTEDEYVFQTNFNIVYPDVEIDPAYDMFTYYRAAVLVNKFNMSHDVSFRYSY